MFQITNKLNGKILRLEYAAAVYILWIGGMDLIQAIEKVVEGKGDFIYD